MMRDFVSSSFGIMINPVRGFYEMKYENKGSIWHIPVLFFLMCLSFSFQRQYSGFVISQPHPLSFNILFDFTLVTLAFILFCVGNWSITCLMDGKGKFIEIMRGVSYSFTPMIIVFTPATILSNAMTGAEAGFYFIVIGISVFWFIAMLFTALIIIHEFTLSRMLFTALLTILSILFIVFILGMLASLVQQMIMYFYYIYREIIFRL